MADNNKAIELLFSVAGGGEISGESGKLIKQQIEQIASNITPKITFDADTSEVEKKLKELSKSYTITVDFKGGSGGKSGALQTTETTELISKLKILKTEMSSLPSLWSKANQAGKEGSEVTAVYRKHFDALYEAYQNNKEALVQYNIASQTEIDLLDRKLTMQGLYTQAKTNDYTTAQTEKEAQNVQKLAVQYKALQSALSELVNRYSKWASSSKEVAAASQEAVNIVNTPLSNDPETAAAQVNTLKSKLKELSTQLSVGARNADTLGTKIRQAFSTQIVQALATAAKSLLLKAFQDIYNTVVEINSALTQLQIVTKATASQISEFTEEITESAKSIGSSISDLTESVTTFARLGFSLEESTKYATLIAQYAKVADTTVSEATTNMTAAIKAFGISGDEFEEALDKLIKVGNNFAVSSEELGTALNNAASSLAAVGNTYEQTLGIFAAANATAQDIDKASTAVRTIAARISASTTELEELGETTDDVLATADLANEMAAYGVSITDANGELLSTYDILAQIADIWDDLNTTQQAAIAGAVAGTRQQNIFYSIMQNWSDAEAAVEACDSATGELSESYETYLDSIEGKLGVLSTTWESISEKVLDSELVSTIIGGFTSIISLLDKVASVGDGAIVVVAALALAFTTLSKLNLKGLFTGLGSVFKSVGTSVASLVVPMKSQAQVALELAQDNLKEAQSEQQLAAAKYEEVIASDTATAAAKLEAQAKLEAADTNVEVAESTVKSAQKEVDATETTMGKLKSSLSEVVSYAMAAYMVFSILNSALEDTGVEADLGSQGIQNLSICVAAFVVAALAGIKAIVAAIKAAEASTIILAIVEAIAAAVVGIGYLIATLCSSPSYDDLKETAEELKEEWQEVQDELEETQETIEELEEELKNLEAARDAAGYTESDTSAYQAEINAIEQEIAALEELAEMKQEASVSTYADAVKATVDALAKYDLGDITSMTSDELATAATEYAELLDGYEYGENSLLDSYFEQYYQMLSQHAIANSSSFADGIIEALTIRFSDAKTAMTKFANSFDKIADITVDSVKAMLDDEELKEYLDYLEEIGAWDGESWDGIVEAIQSLHTSLVKLSRVDIADDIETLSDKFDALADALDDVADSGVIALDTLETLLESYPSLLEKYFTKSVDGYILNSDYSDLSNYDILKDMAITDLQTYVDALVDAQSALSKLTEEDAEYETALYNLAVAQDNLNDKELEWATLLRETAIEEETDRLEAEQDALEDQLDAYQDLIDIRKDLLETYQEELDYQKELASKQKTVSQLSTQLALSKLDTSAAGQARTRELQSELDEAQEELDDYTLEHAIDVITSQLDAEEAAYEKWINKQISLIDDAIDDLSTTLTGILTETGITLEDGTVESLAALLAQATANDKSDMAQLYNDLNNSDVSTDNTTAFQSAYSSAISSGDYQTADSLYSAAKTDYDNATTTETEEEEDDGYTTAQKEMADAMHLLSGSSASGMKAFKSGDNGEVKYHGNTYKVEEDSKPDNETDLYVAAYSINGSDKGYVDRKVFEYDGGLYAMVDGAVVKLRKRGSNKGYNNLYNEWDSNGRNEAVYHTGGFVGGLESNEEFAKLLKGEFVSTPAQMDRFINQTLPALTSYSSGGTTYNAPLISIECGSVTQDTLPDLETMVDEAVKKIQKQIDSGLSRNGYKRTVGKFSSTS